MQTVIFTDLDGTLFDIPKKPPMNMKMATVDRDGYPGSFMSERQFALWEMLNRMGMVIPVTGRSRKALSRVLLPFPSWKAAAYGAIIINPDGSIDEEWLERTRPLLLPLDDIAHELKKRFRADHARVQIIREKELGDIYVSVKNFKRKDGLWQFLSALCGESLDFQINGSDITVIPKGISKRDAVIRIMDKIGEDIFSIGVGNSPYDIAFMKACNFQLPVGDCAKLLSFNIWRSREEDVFG